jgi:hypothetical protein
VALAGVAGRNCGAGRLTEFASDVPDTTNMGAHSATNPTFVRGCL